MRILWSILFLLSFTLISSCSKEKPEQNLLLGNWNFSKLSRTNGKEYYDGEYVRSFTTNSTNAKNQLVFSLDKSYSSNFSCEIVSFIIHLNDMSTEVAPPSYLSMHGNGAFIYEPSSKELTIQDGILKGKYIVNTLNEKELVMSHHYDYSYKDSCHTYGTIYDQSYFFTK